MNSNEMLDKASPQNTADGGVAAVDRAFAILGAFDAERNVLPLAELARRTGLYKSTILRLMNSLERAGFIRRLPDGQFAIGHEPLRLAPLYQSSFRLRDIIYPKLETLSEDSGETSSFYVIENDSRVVLFRVEPRRSVRVSIHEGDRFPLQAGASGKILRTFGLSAEHALPEVREQFWASSFGERDPDTAAVSVPVFGVNNELKGALTLSGPSERFNEDVIKGARNMLLKLAAQATVALGGDSRELQQALARLEG
ncbi:IclR family transcriptional regulator [Pseudomonas chlororaphis]|jgi:DNA-binding IclR family transcriptional regulator|uniref:IclR family transcriptional regulator n=1 Tax=Pseudomonas chlororaphis TaxID=587753 RepID=UPI000F5778D7|nr:IclR family transcriptional regulator [Pseudomonas chlororaphis]AZD74104.1 Transcriptional regulator, IclR family [Pseudomonas chlororaphis subsp. aurantiaca]UVE43392.1 IclR family transcriptional regulator [Pseudomonas chlororaphis]